MGEMCTHLLLCLQQPGEHPHPWRCLCSIPAVQAPKWCTEPNVQISHTAVEMGRDLWAQFQWGHLGLHSALPATCFKAPQPSPYPRFIYFFYKKPNFSPISCVFICLCTAGLDEAPSEGLSSPRPQPPPSHPRPRAAPPPSLCISWRSVPNPKSPKSSETRGQEWKTLRRPKCKLQRSATQPPDSKWQPFISEEGGCK